VQGKIGCATSSDSVTWVAEEPFEHGWMYWRKDTERIYVLYGTGNWEEYSNPWHEGDPVYSCPDASTPSQSPPTPSLGFGKVWCTYPHVRQNLSWATAAEGGTNATVQHFQHGLMLRTDGRTWILYDGGAWERR
jgi:hypothetical protein